MMMDRIQTLRNKVQQEKGRKIQLEKSIQDTKDGLRDNRRLLSRHEQAREIIRDVGLATQEQLQVHISDITSLALEAVFPVPYELVAEFVQRRNKTVCDLYFTREGNRMNPLDSSGYGAVDIASMALRIAAWSMQTPKKRNVIILDEPFRFLSENYQEQASQMIKELSTRLGIQFLIISHNATLAGFADKTFRVRKKNGKSIVT
jgi:DNA repair ATPase RecN